MPAKLYIINVLSTDYYDDCHIAGSIHIPGNDLESHAQDFEKDATLVVYCASYACSASAQAYHTLKALGFTNVHAYEGGMAEWYQLGYPSEGACTLEYLSQDHAPAEDDRGVMQVSAQALKAMMDAQSGGE